MSAERCVPFYHYTSERGLQGILRDGRIQPSDPTRGDAVEGPGSYGTNLVPSMRAKGIAENNWDGGWEQAVHNGKLDRWLRCEVPASELQQHPGHGNTSHGQILVHPQGIDLNKYPTKFGTVGKHTVPQGHRYMPSPDPAQGHQYMNMPSPNPARGGGFPGGTPTPERAIRAPTLGSFGCDRTPMKSAAPWRSSQDCSGNMVSSPDFACDSYKSSHGPSCPYPSGGGNYCWVEADSEEVDKGDPSASSPCQFESPTVDHSGYNAQGNHYESYNDGSYRYDNQDGSSYVRDADGGAIYTSPVGDIYEYPSGTCSSGDHVDAGCYSDNGYSGGGYSDGGYSDGGYADDGYSDGDY